MPFTPGMPRHAAAAIKERFAATTTNGIKDPILVLDAPSIVCSVTEGVTLTNRMTGITDMVVAGDDGDEIVASVDGNVDVVVLGEGVQPTPIPDTQAPTIPGSVTAAKSGSDVLLTWTPATDDMYVAGYEVRVDGGAAFAAVSPYLHAAAGSADHTYEVSSIDGAGNRSPWSAAAIYIAPDITAPSTPGSAQATKSGDDVVLTWTASTDVKGVTGYEVRKDNGTPFVATSPYTDAGAAGADHAYQVSALDAAGNRSGWASASYTYIAPDITAPTAPTGLAAVASGDDVLISWTASTDAVGVVGYELRKDAGTPVAATSPFIDTAGAGADHTYEVSALDAAGNRSIWTQVAYTYTAPPEVGPAPGTYTSPMFDQVRAVKIGTTDGTSTIPFPLVLPASSGSTSSPRLLLVVMPPGVAMSATTDNQQRGYAIARTYEGAPYTAVNGTPNAVGDVWAVADASLGYVPKPFLDAPAPAGYSLDDGWAPSAPPSPTVIVDVAAKTVHVTGYSDLAGLVPFGDINMLTDQGSLYAGTYPRATQYTFDPDGSMTITGDWGSFWNQATHPNTNALLPPVTLRFYASEAAGFAHVKSVPVTQVIQPPPPEAHLTGTTVRPVLTLENFAIDPSAFVQVQFWSGATFLGHHNNPTKTGVSGGTIVVTPTTDFIANAGGSPTDATRVLLVNGPGFTVLEVTLDSNTVTAPVQIIPFEMETYAKGGTLRSNAEFSAGVGRDLGSSSFLNRIDLPPIEGPGSLEIYGLTEVGSARRFDVYANDVLIEAGRACEGSSFSWSGLIYTLPLVAGENRVHFVKGVGDFPVFDYFKAPDALVLDESAWLHPGSQQVTVVGGRGKAGITKIELLVPADGGPDFVDTAWAQGDGVTATIIDVVTDAGPGWSVTSAPNNTGPLGNRPNTKAVRVWYGDWATPDYDEFTTVLQVMPPGYEVPPPPTPAPEVIALHPKSEALVGTAGPGLTALQGVTFSEPRTLLGLSFMGYFGSGRDVPAQVVVFDNFGTLLYQGDVASVRDQDNVRSAMIPADFDLEANLAYNIGFFVSGAASVMGSAQSFPHSHGGLTVSSGFRYSEASGPAWGTAMSGYEAAFELSLSPV